MRTLIGLLFIASCTTAPRASYTATRTSYGDTPVSLLPDAVEIAREKHYDVAALDPARGEFVALPSADASGVHTAMVVRVGVVDRTCSRRGRNCQAGQRTYVDVTPIAFRDGQELPASAEARTSADDLSWAILSSARH
ncbi:MAG TPA: hypothetical protein VGM88_12735 [Kofleriaceae bacterium]|jgi:hypothetical protein